MNALIKTNTIQDTFLHALSIILTSFEVNCFFYSLRKKVPNFFFGSLLVLSLDILDIEDLNFIDSYHLFSQPVLYDRQS